VTETLERGTGAGWYPDPEHPEAWRYWDGAQWTEHRSPGGGGGPGDTGGQLRGASRGPWMALVAAALVAVVVGGGLLLVDDRDSRSDGPDPTALSSGEGTVADQAGGAIWEEVLGVSMYDDAVTRWADSCGLDVYDERLLCNAQGWEMKLDPPTETVEEVILYPSTNTDMIAGYAGPMPYGMSWDDPVEAFTATLGAPDQYGGGYGVPVYLQYDQLGPYYLQVELAVSHVDDVASTTPINALTLGLLGGTALE
jgi:hypothetical protein